MLWEKLRGSFEEFTSTFPGKYMVAMAISALVGLLLVLCLLSGR